MSGRFWAEVLRLSLMVCALQAFWILVTGHSLGDDHQYWDGLFTLLGG